MPSSNINQDDHHLLKSEEFTEKKIKKEGEEEKEIELSEDYNSNNLNAAEQKLQAPAPVFTNSISRIMPPAT